MASKTRDVQRQKQERQRKRELFNEECERTRFWHIGGIAVCVITLMLLFVTFVEVYNTDVGVEVKASGWSFFVAGITGKYSSTAKVYGNLAVPFYYYASSWCKIVGVITTVAVFLTIVLIGLEVLILVKRYYSLTYIAVFVGLIAAILLLVAFTVSLDMKNGDILTTYCYNNTACSIRSYAVIPFVAMLLYMAYNVYLSVRLIRAYSILK